MNITTRFATAICTAFLLSLVTGCSSNMATPKSISNTAAYPKLLQRADANKRYVIMYSGVDTYHVKSVQVEKSKQQFTVYLSKVDSLHTSSLRNAGTSNGKLLQMYMRDSASYTLDEPHTIPIDKVAKMEVTH